MVQTRAEKVARVADFVDPIEVEGSDSGTLLISWGGTYGACHTAMKQAVAEGLSVGMSTVAGLVRFRLTWAT